jgi:hypothetical protein
VDERAAVLSEARPLLVRMALLSYGSVQAYGRRRGAGAVGGDPPTGEAHPMHERWSALLAAAETAEQARATLERARSEYGAHVRRQLVPTTTETWDELAERIVADGWGVSARDCATAMRCSITLVRRARLAAYRHPESGYGLPAPRRDVLAWARDLDDAGLSVRQIEALTGMAMATVWRRVRRVSG